MARTNHQKLRVGIVGAGDIVRTRHLPGLEKAFRSRDRGRLEFHLRKRGKILPGERAPRHPDAELGRPALAPRYRHRLDRHAALHAFGRHRLRPRSGQTRFLPGPHVDGPGRSRGNARRLETLSRAGHDALSAAVWVARRSAREKTARGELSRPAAPHPAAMFHRRLSERGSRRRIGGSGSRSAG